MSKKYRVITGAALMLLLLIAGCEAEESNKASINVGNADDIEVVEDGLPLDPGEAGKATLAGIDSDNDGVRDDIQRWLAVELSDKPVVRALAGEMAIQSQNFLFKAHDKVSALEAHRLYGIARSCLKYYFGLTDGRSIIFEMHARFHNTKERTLGYMRGTRFLSGSFLFSPNVSRLSDSDKKVLCKL